MLHRSPCKRQNAAAAGVYVQRSGRRAPFAERAHYVHSTGGVADVQYCCGALCFFGTPVLGPLTTASGPKDPG